MEKLEQKKNGRENEHEIKVITWINSVYAIQAYALEKCGHKFGFKLFSIKSNFISDLSQCFKLVIDELSVVYKDTLEIHVIKHSWYWLVNQ